jgi:hypothetical protein
VAYPMSCSQNDPGDKRRWTEWLYNSFLTWSLIHGFLIFQFALNVEFLER